MKVCTRCGAKNKSDDWKCSVCHFEPIKIEGFYSFAPELAFSESGFDAKLFPNLYSVESKNFWFRSRNKIIILFLEKAVKKLDSFLEIGCGTGFVLDGIRKKFLNTIFFGCELDCRGLRFAEKRLQDVFLFQMDARNIPFEKEFDAIGIFDVLEHIKEDELVLSQVYCSLSDNGIVLITVPQHQFLWSPTDEIAHHVRRYSRKELIKKVKKVGFEVIDSASFVSLLFPLMFVSRWKTRNVKATTGEVDLGAELKINWFFNLLLEVVMGLEMSLIRLGVRFPFGGSLLLVARKTVSEKYDPI